MSDFLQPPWTAACQAPPFLTVSWTFFRFISIESVMLSNYLIFYCLLLLLPSIFPNTRVFPDEWAPCIRWPKYWSFSFNISPSSDYSGLVFFMIDWFDLLAVQGTLKSSLAPQFESISFLVSLQANSHICIHDYGKNYSFD